MLEKLIHPLTPNKFFLKHFETKPFIASRKQPGYFSFLLQAKDLDPLFTSKPLQNTSPCTSQNFPKSFLPELQSQGLCKAVITPKDSPCYPLTSQSHDLMFLQIHGCMRWKIYSPSRELLYDFVLENGDTLYLPKEFFFEAHKQEDRPSVHIEITKHAKSWQKHFADRFKMLSQKHSFFHSSLPTGLTLPSSCPLSEYFPENDPEEILKQIREAWHSSLPQ